MERLLGFCNRATYAEDLQVLSWFTHPRVGSQEGNVCIFVLLNDLVTTQIKLLIFKSKHERVWHAVVIVWILIHMMS